MPTNFGENPILLDNLQIWRQNWIVKDNPKKGPHIPEIAPKYLNTLAFIYRNEVD